MLALLILTAGLQVHEWGVITQDPIALTGFRADNQPGVEVPVNELEDRAPVLYFHGDPCTIDLRITFPNMGYATELLPEPSEGGVNSTYAVWNDLELSDQPGCRTDYGWANWTQCSFPVPLWRQVEALEIISGSFNDRFIYYECAPGSPGDLPFINQSGNQSMRMPYGEIPCIVLTSSQGMPMYGVFTLAEILTSIPKGLQFLDEPAVLRREVNRWAEGILNEDEFNAFWNTWESDFLQSSSEQVMILYPVPEETLNGIALIEVVPDIDISVEISRFIVAELPYRTE